MENQFQAFKKKGKRKATSESFLQQTVPPSPCQKASWDDTTTEIFIKVCVDMVKKGYRPTSHFDKKGWNMVVARFRQETNRKYSKSQLKNKWDNLKREYGWWKNMLKGESGLGWNHERQTVEASDQWWLDKMKLIPECIKFREKGILLKDDQDLLFNDVYASGEHAWAPSSGNLPPYMQGVEEHEEETSDESDDSYFPAQDIVRDDSTQKISKNSAKTASSSKKRSQESSSTSQTRDKRSSATEGLKKSLDRMIEAIESSSATVNSIKNSVQGFSITEVVQILSNLPGVIIGDPLYMRPCDLFEASPASREMFVAIKNDDVRLQWLKNKCLPPS